MPRKKKHGAQSGLGTQNNPLTQGPTRPRLAREKVAKCSTNYSVLVFKFLGLQHTSGKLCLSVISSFQAKRHGRVDMAGWKGRPRQKKRAGHEGSAKQLPGKKPAQAKRLDRAKSNQGLQGLQIKEAQQCMKAFWAKRVTSA